MHNVSLGSGCKVVFSFLTDCSIGENSKIGPFSRLRDNVTILNDVSIGNFVEIKNSTIGTSTRINHYSYIGDSLIGNNVNIGAGTVTCNFDGENKHQTLIEDSSFIGSGTMLIAPVVIGEGSKTGAGSVVTKDVDPFTVVVGNPAQLLDN